MAEVVEAQAGQPGATDGGAEDPVAELVVVEITSVDHQAGADEITAVRVGRRAAADLNLEDESVLRMKSVTS